MAMKVVLVLFLLMISLEEGQHRLKCGVRCGVVCGVRCGVWCEV